MERDVDGDGSCIETRETEEQSSGAVSCSILTLDHVGEVILTFNSDGLSWNLVAAPLDNVNLFISLILLKFVLNYDDYALILVCFLLIKLKREAGLF